MQSRLDTEEITREKCNKREGTKIVYLTNKRLRNKARQEVKKKEESEA